MANTFKKLTALLIITTSITGCGSGQTAETRNIKQVTDGQSNEIKLRNVLIVKTLDSQGVLVATLVNTSDESDSIVGISIGAVVATYTAKSSELIKNKPIIFVGDSANADAFIPGLSKNAGERIGVTFTFAKAAPLTLDALIVNGEGIYQDLVRSAPDIVASATPAP
jgi:hypothetical protein